MSELFEQMTAGTIGPAIHLYQLLGGQSSAPSVDVNRPRKAVS